MAGFTTGAGEPLLSPLLRALSATAEVLEDPSSSAFRSLEAELDVVVRLLRAELNANIKAGPSGPALDWSTPESKILVQCVVALSDYYDVVAKWLEDSGANWGSHIFSAIDFEQIAFARIADHNVASSGLKLLIGGLSVDLLDALTKLARLGLAAARASTDIERALSRICRQVDVEMQKAVGPTFIELAEDCESVGETTARLGLAEYQRLMASGGMFALKSWDGELVHPKFQFGPAGREISPLCEDLLSSTTLDPTSWAECHWISTNLADGHDLAWFDAELKDICRVKSEWGKPVVRDFSNDALAAPITAVDPGERFFRITSSDHTPFFFAQAPADATLNGPGGRFDLSAGSPRGSTYLSGGAIGACKEVFGYRPVAVLSDLLSRRLWYLEPMETLSPVRDLTGQNVHLSGTSIRSESQGVADVVASDQRAGEPTAVAMTVALRTEAGQKALVLFGTPQAGLPAGSKLGPWSVRGVSVLADDDVWEYVAGRYDKREFPFVLQRMPSEVHVNAA